jgi:hypothetical protein
MAIDGAGDAVSRHKLQELRHRNAVGNPPDLPAATAPAPEFWRQLLK